ncbi:MAG: hypothetical protein GY898_13065 [Proteobacteria bacterium]|nr:hypothetical protein [Pseudomonadota bacterium]
MELTTGHPEGTLESLDEARRQGLPDLPASLVNRAVAARLLGNEAEYAAALEGLARLGIPEDQARARVDRLLQ